MDGYNVAMNAEGVITMRCLICETGELIPETGECRFCHYLGNLFPSVGESSITPTSDNVITFPIDRFDVECDRIESLIVRWKKFRNAHRELANIDLSCTTGLLLEISQGFTQENNKGADSK